MWRKSPKRRSGSLTKWHKRQGEARQEGIRWNTHHGSVTSKYTVQVQIAGQLLKMELDKGEVISVISEESYRRHLCQYPLMETNMRLKDYQGNSLKVKGVVWVPVKYEKED